MPTSRRRPGLRPLAAINLTPLLDVMCILLITFMIVAPTLKSGLKIDLPRVENSPKLTPRKSFTISISKPLVEGGSPRMYLEDRLMNLDEMRGALTDIRSRFAPEVDVLIEADRVVPCEAMLQVLALTKDVGLESVGVVTIVPEPEKAKK